MSGHRRKRAPDRVTSELFVSVMAKRQRTLAEKNLLVAQSGAWVARGGSILDFHEFLVESDNAVPPASLRRWKKSKRDTGQVNSPVDRRGAPPKLEPNHKRLLAGLFLPKISPLSRFIVILAETSYTTL
jgi:hypothetical protein